MRYGDLLARAWNIFWRQKALWLFYFVTMLPILVYSYISTFLDPTVDYFSSGFGVIGIGLLVSLISLLLTTFAQIGIIRGVYKSSKDSLLVLTFQDIYDEAPPRYGRTLVFFLLSYAVVIVLVVIFGLGLAGLAAAGAGTEASIAGLLPICMCLLMPVAVIVGIIFQQMTIALIVDDLTIGEAIKRGWDVFRMNFGEYMVISLIIFAISFGFGIAIMMPSFCVMGSYLSEMAGSGAIDPAGFTGPTPWYYNLVSLIISLLSTIFGIYVMAIFVLAYLDLADRSGLRNVNQLSDDDLEPA